MGQGRSGDLDEPAIRLFLETEYPRLVGAVAMVAGSRAVAEDCVQEALARAWERTERGEHIGSLVAWVTTVAMNLSKSWLRRVRVEREAQPKLVPGAGAQSQDGSAVDVRRALAALPRRQREATVLRYYLGRATRGPNSRPSPSLALGRRLLVEPEGYPTHS